VAAAQIEQIGGWHVSAAVEIDMIERTGGTGDSHRRQHILAIVVEEQWRNRATGKDTHPPCYVPAKFDQKPVRALIE